MSEKRVARLNSLLKEVISDVLTREIKNPGLPSLITVTNVEITSDLRYAKVYISVIGDAAIKKKTIEVLTAAAGFIAVRASKKVTMRYFPELRFLIDESVEKQSRIEDVLKEIEEEKNRRANG